MCLADSPELRLAVESLRAVLTAPGEYNLPRCVLITGEPGVGKTLLAHQLAQSAQPDRAYKAFNCAALEPDSEDKVPLGGPMCGKGLVGDAEYGILILDKVDELPLAMQANLLSAIESVHSELNFGTSACRPHKVRCAFIFTSSKNLRAEVAAGRFRRDLLDAICAHSLELPPLRDRIAGAGGDALLGSLITTLCDQHGHLGLSDGSKKALLKFAKRHTWPGNTRELRQMVQNIAARSLARGTSAVDHADVLALIKDKARGAATETPSPVETKCLSYDIKCLYPAFKHGEIDAIFRIAQESLSCADAGKKFFEGGRRISNYSDAFSKHLKAYGLKWDKDEPTHIIRL